MVNKALEETVRPMAPTLFEVRDIISEAERGCLRSARSFAELISCAAASIEPSKHKSLSTLVTEAVLAASSLTSASRSASSDHPSDLLRTMKAVLAHYNALEKELWEHPLRRDADHLFSLLVFARTETTTAERYNTAAANLSKATRWGSTLHATIPDHVVLAAGIRAQRRDLVWGVAAAVACSDLLNFDPRALNILSRDTGCPSNLLRAVGTGTVSVEDAVLAASMLVQPSSAS
jgi:hypothetical protein